MGLYLFDSSDVLRKKTFLNPSKIAAFFMLFVVTSLLLSFTYEESSQEDCNSQLHSNDSFTTTPYFVLEEIPGKFRMIKAVYSDYEIILRPESLEYFDTGSGVPAQFVFENCNGNIQPDGLNLISSEEVPIKNKAMGEVLQSTTMEVTKYEKVVYRNAYDNLDLEISLNTEGGIHVELEEKIKGAASKFNMKPRLISSEYNTSQRSIALAKSNKILKIKSNNDKIDFVEGNGFKSQRPEQYSENKSFDITLK